MIGYFGPAGTFTHQALRTVTDAEARPFGSVQAVLQAVRAGDIEAGLVPIENSVEGGVTATLDNLASGEPLVIVSEILLPVSFVLGVRPGTTLADVRSVLTHPHAHAQTRDWVVANLPGAIVTETKSRPKKTPVTSPNEKSALASGDASASSGLAKSRVPASITARPGRNLSVAGLGVDSVSISMGCMWDADALCAR